MTIPEYVLTALEAFRNDGGANVYDCYAALRYMDTQKHYKAAEWLLDNRHRYVEALREMGRRLTA